MSVDDLRALGTGMGRTAKRVLALMALRLLAGLLVLVCLSFAGAVFLFRGASGTPTIPQLESFTGVKFPRTSRVIRGHYEGWQDYTYAALLDFDARDTESFLRSIRSSGRSPRAVFSREDRFGIGDESSPLGGHENPQWWDPDSVSRFIAIRLESSHYVYMLISMDGVGRRKVYVFAFNT